MKKIPDPIDLSKIALSGKLLEDIEKISENIHNTWAKNRMDRGWGYGEKFDEKEKSHPCLVPYEELPELEKDMDRATVTQTVKMLFYLGYSIEKEKD